MSEDKRKDLAPRTLTVVFADTHRTMIAVSFENDHIPFRRRSVQIELTPEQREQLAPRCVGESRGHDVHEELVTCWLEPVEDEGGER